MTRQYLADKLYYSTVQIIGNNKTGTAFFTSMTLEVWRKYF